MLTRVSLLLLVLCHSVLYHLIPSKLMGGLMGGKRKVKRQKRELNRLEAVSLKKLKPGMHNDGGGLYLEVKASGSRSSILRTMVRGKRRDKGLGGLSTRSLADARQAAV